MVKHHYGENHLSGSSSQRKWRLIECREVLAARYVCRAIWRAMDSLFFAASCSVTVRLRCLLSGASPSHRSGVSGTDEGVRP